MLSVVDTRFAAEHGPDECSVCWAIDMLDLGMVSSMADDMANLEALDVSDVSDASDASDASADTHSFFAQRSHLYAELGIVDYWLLVLQSAELRTHCTHAAYQSQPQRLWHVGDRVSPASIPELKLAVQEPLPLYFLTPTSKGPRNYASHALPLRFCSSLVLFLLAACSMG